MAQVSGLRFKLLYSNWYAIDNQRFPISNGLHTEVVDWIKKSISEKNLRHFNEDFLTIREIDDQFLYNSPESGYWFRISNFYYHFCKNYGKENIIYEDDIQDDDEVIYYYPIEVECNPLAYLIEEKTFIKDGTTFDYKFERTLSSKVLQGLQQGKIKLLFANLIDPGIEPGVLLDLENSLGKYNIPSNSIICLQGNSRPEYYDLSPDSQLTMLEGCISLYQMANEKEKYPRMTQIGVIGDYVRPTDLDNIQRSKKFLSFNRFCNRPHRLGILYAALKYNLLDDGYFSFLYIEDYNVEDFLKIILPNESNLEKYIQLIKKVVPYELDTYHLSSQEKITFFTPDCNNKLHYIDSYLHIVSETQFNTRGTPFMSEKTWRPILNLQPFIYVGNHLALNMLRELGFKTFHPFIDESYDNEQDPAQRWKLIERELEKFSHMTIEDIHNWYYSIKDILIYNQELLFKYADHNPIKSIFTED
jgi:hypothetical protein